MALKPSTENLLMKEITKSKKLVLSKSDFVVKIIRDDKTMKEILDEIMEKCEPEVKKAALKAGEAWNGVNYAYFTSRAWPM